LKHADSNLLRPDSQWKVLPGGANAREIIAIFILITPFTKKESASAAVESGLRAPVWRLIKFDKETGQTKRLDIMQNFGQNNPEPAHRQFRFFFQ
jgi:hypothetical protein